MKNDKKKIYKKKNIIALSLAMTMIASVPMSTFAQAKNAEIATPKVTSSSETKQQAKVQPIGKEIITFVGKVPSPQDGIENLSELGKTAKVSWKGQAPDVSQEGEQKVDIEVSFTDKDSSNPRKVTVTTNLKVVNKDKFKKELEEKISEAEDLEKSTKTSKDGKDIDPQEKWATKEQHDALKGLIEVAKQLKVSDEIRVLDSTKSDLENGIKAFKDACKEGLKKAVDKSPLEDKINDAKKLKDSVKESTDGSDIAIGEKWVTSQDKQNLQAAITKAENVLKEADLTEEKVTNAVTELTTAMGTFEKVKKDGTKQDVVDKKPLEYKINEAEALIKKTENNEILVVADGTTADKVEKGKYFVTNSEKIALKNGINTAKDILKKQGVTSEEILLGKRALEGVINAFNKAAEKVGTKDDDKELINKRNELYSLHLESKRLLESVRAAKDSEIVGGNIVANKVPRGTKVAKAEDIEAFKAAKNNADNYVNDNLEQVKEKINALTQAKNTFKTKIVEGTGSILTEADKFTPETKTLYVDRNEKVDIKKGLLNKPSNATLEVIDDVSTSTSGTKYGKLKITFSDKSAKEVKITVIVRSNSSSTKTTLEISRREYRDGYFYGTVRDSKNNRVSRATVTLYDYDDRRVRDVVTDSDGDFRIYVGDKYYDDFGKYDGYDVYYDRLRDEYYYYRYNNERVYLGSWTPSNSSRYNGYYLIATKSDYYTSSKYRLGYYNGSSYNSETRVYPTSIRRGNYSVSGYVKSYPNRTIEVRDGNTYLGRTTTDSNGYFSLSWNSPSISVNRSLDYYIIGLNKNSKTPEITKAVAGTKIIKGSAGAYAKVEVYDSNNNRLGYTTADYKGNYTINLNRELRANERITMKATESGKNTTSQDYIIGTNTENNNESVSRKSYIVGYPDGTFRPQGKVTRAEAAQMFGTLLNGGTNFGTTRETKFKDANNDWFSPAINYTVSKGLISGYEDGTFKPNQNITRAEFAQMISGYVKEGYPGSSNFKDVKGHWASDAIDAVYGNKAIKGYPDGTFKPNQDITRAEAVTILNAVFGRNTKQESLKNISTKNLTTFKDVSSSFWAYYEILDASNSHTSQKAAGSTDVEIWK